MRLGVSPAVGHMFDDFEEVQDLEKAAEADLRLAKMLKKAMGVCAAIILVTALFMLASCAPNQPQDYYLFIV